MERFSSFDQSEAIADNPIEDETPGATSEANDTINSADLEVYRPTEEMAESMALVSHRTNANDPYDESMAMFDIPNNITSPSAKRFSVDISEERKSLSSQPVKKVDFINVDLPFHNERWKWINEPMASTTDRERIRVLIITWNMFGRTPQKNLGDIFPPQITHHLVAVGTQECLRSIGKSLVNSQMKPWEDCVQANLGSNYVMIRSHTLGPTHIGVWAHQTIVPLVKNIDSASVVTGAANMIANKGGAGISFQIVDHDFCFISWHLPAGQKNVKKRNRAMNRIERGMPLPRQKGKSGGVSDRNHFTFFFGDLNYRINGDRDAVEFLSKQGALKILHRNDQLIRAMEAKEIPKGYIEGPLNFPPTYRYDPGTNQFDSSKKRRIPAYCDRILFKDNSKGDQIKQVNYDSIGNNYSDHRPVFAQFLVTIGGHTLDGSSTTETFAISKKSRACSIF